MQEAIFKSSVLVEALPYMQRFKGKYIVVKFGGSVLTQEYHLRNVLQDLVFMAQAGMRPVLVHGGGPLITQAMKKCGKEPVFLNGQRITDEETLEIAKDVLIGDVAARIVSIVAGFGAKAESVNAAGAISAKKYLPNGDDLGFVGQVSSVDVGLFDRLAEEGIISIVSPLGLDESGQLYNINGDVAAWKIAAELKAEKLVFLSNTRGILRNIDDDQSLISTIRQDRIEQYVESGVISGGMIPKIEAANSALTHGVHKTHIVDGRLRHALLVEIFSKEGIGTQIIPSDEPEGATTTATRELYDQYVIGNYTRQPMVIVRGKGSRVWDADNKGYLDLFPGWAVSGIGYCHDKVVAALKSQSEKLLHASNNFHLQAQGELARLIAEHAFGGKSFFCNSGAEANEAALKLARLFHGGKRKRIITTKNSFHGRTFGSVSATGQPDYQKGFQPIVPGFEYVAFNDKAALEAAMADDVYAVMLEPIQGEGGINMADDDYMCLIRSLCDKHGSLMIVDEVQTCMGRSGKLFAYQNYDVVPDIMTLAKSLGGGVAIGVMTARADIAAAMGPGTHGSTFGGNPLACRAGIAVFDAIREEKMMDNVEVVGAYLWQRLNEMKNKFPIIKGLRGRALMVGIELNKPGQDIVATCLARGLIINCTQGSVLRLLPAINISVEELEEGLTILSGILEEDV